MKNIICGMKRGGGIKEEGGIMVEAKEAKEIEKGSNGGNVV
jgi:hypothetical protein